jgi:hypothetical protein
MALLNLFPIPGEKRGENSVIGLVIVSKYTPSPLSKKKFPF